MKCFIERFVLGQLIKIQVIYFSNFIRFNSRGDIKKVWILFHFFKIKLSLKKISYLSRCRSELMSQSTLGGPTLGVICESKSHLITFFETSINLFVFYSPLVALAGVNGKEVFHFNLPVHNGTWFEWCTKLVLALIAINTMYSGSYS